MKKVLLASLYVIFIALLTTVLYSWSNFRTAIYPEPVLDTVICLSVLGILHFYIQKLRLIVAAHNLAAKLNGKGEPDPNLLNELLDIAKNKNV